MFVSSRHHSRFFCSNFLRLIGIFFVVGGIGIGSLYALYWMPQMTSVSVVFYGSPLLDVSYLQTAFFAEQMRSSFLRFLGPDSLVFWLFRDRDAIVLSSVPRVASLTTAFDIFDRRLMITVAERSFEHAWCRSEEECYAFDAHGVLYASTPTLKGSLILKVFDSYAPPPVLGTPFIKNTLSRERFFEVLRVLADGGYHVVSARIRDPHVHEWEVHLEGGPTLFFSFNFVPANLPFIVNDVFSRLRFDELSSIDLRVPHKMYYQ